MRCALIENEIVTNLIEIHPINIAEFPEAVLINNYLVSIGDVYKDGIFYRDNEPVLTSEQSYEQILGEAYQEITELDAIILDTTYENIIGGLE